MQNERINFYLEYCEIAVINIMRMSDKESKPNQFAKRYKIFDWISNFHEDLLMNKIYLSSNLYLIIKDIILIYILNKMPQISNDR